MGSIGRLSGRETVRQGEEPRPTIRHGGDLSEAHRRFPHAPQPWIDLSTGINPVPYPIPALPSALFQRLRSPADGAALEAAAARAYGAADPEEVAAAPGTQSMIELLPRLLSPELSGRVVVVAPTYAEHAHAWRKAGRIVEEARNVDPRLLGDDAGVGVVVAVNPNNPDGRILSRAVLDDLAARVARRGGWLVADEAFADFETGAGFESLIPNRPPRVIVLRSFGKTYGLAGIRLGFAVAEARVARAVRSALGPWAVSGPALALGRAALLDRRWLRAAAAARDADARRLDAALSFVGRVLGGTRLFRLLQTPDAPALFEALGRAGIWVRRFEDNARRLRFGLPGSEAEWDRVEAALRGGRGADAPRFEA